jgi:NADH dehydrogenase
MQATNRLPAQGLPVKVLVVGGSGFIGRETVRRLLAAGHRVRVLSRGTRDVVPGAEVARGSVLEPVGLPSACAGCDVVIYLAGVIAEVGDQTYARIHAEGVANVLDAVRGTAVRRWIHMSALGARPDAPSRYHRTKWAGEEKVRASGLDGTILRPSLVYGRGDGFLNLFAGLARWSPVLPLMGGGAMEFQPIAVEDVARCLVASVDATGQRGAITVCGRDRVTLRGIVEAVLGATGRRRILVPVPWWLARIQAVACEWIFPALLRKAPPLNRDQLLMLAEGNTGDPTAMVREYGFEPRPFADGVRAMFGGGAET